MSNNDLISREDLKKAIENYLAKRQDVIIWDVDLFDILDNAPTVNDCPNCEYKLEADYIRSSSSYYELIALRKFKEEHEIKSFIDYKNNNSAK